MSARAGVCLRLFECIGARTVVCGCEKVCVRAHVSPSQEMDERRAQVARLKHLSGRSRVVESRRQMGTGNSPSSEPAPVTQTFFKKALSFKRRKADANAPRSTTLVVRGGALDTRGLLLAKASAGSQTVSSVSSAADLAPSSVTPEPLLVKGGHNDSTPLLTLAGRASMASLASVASLPRLESAGTLPPVSTHRAHAPPMMLSVASVTSMPGGLPAAPFSPASPSSRGLAFIAEANSLSSPTVPFSNSQKEQREAASEVTAVTEADAPSSPTAPLKRGRSRSVTTEGTTGPAPLAQGRCRSAIIESNTGSLPGAPSSPSALLGPGRGRKTNPEGPSSGAVTRMLASQVLGTSKGARRKSVQAVARFAGRQALGRMAPLPGIQANVRARAASIPLEPGKCNLETVCSVIIFKFLRCVSSPPPPVRAPPL